MARTMPQPVLCSRGTLMKARTNRPTKAVIAAAAVFAVLLIAKAWYSSALGPTKAGEKTIEVKQGQTTSQISETLERANLIKSRTAFEWHVRLNKIASRFKSGDFQLSGDKRATEIAIALTETPMKKRLTIKEGQTQEEIASRLDEQGVFSKKEFSDLKAADFDYGFLRGLPKDANLDGYIFPETYELPREETTAADLAKVFLTQFEKELTENLQDDLKQGDRSLRDTVIVASIVEKEVRSDADRRVVAGIMYKRLRENISLGADATIYYGLDKPFTEPLTKQDLDSDNPYNTRKFKGLPPGPIGNPGLSSLKAAANPEESEFFYYLSEPKDGKTIFAKTLEEHEANIRKYLR